jgi:hypothetical protein
VDENHEASSRTALRDIEELIAIGVMEQQEAGGRSTSYRLKKAARFENKIANIGASDSERKHWCLFQDELTILRADHLRVAPSSIDI